ncbi:PPC domain-containing protein [Haloarchaeobius litoreus]|uniref:PPC domain-containing protein n=1 Tax=Haloarchaeobius litoreus TaxID=755306 RepID=A0ABD6DNQ3_9EURY|nr:PPC domain-containing protein [Haloarchaeobius litoreus]
MSLEDKRRRSFLLAGATALTGGLAGCTGLLDETDLEDGTANGTTDSTPTAPTTTAEPIDLPVEGEATRIEYGASVSGELTASAPSDPQFEGYYQPYTFVGSAGDVVQISMTSPGGDPYLFLLDEQGNVLEENDDDATSFNSAIGGFELPSDGGYIILAGSFSDTIDFEYQLSLTQVQSDLRSIAVGETRTGTIDSSDPQSDEYNGYYEPVTLDVGSEMAVNVAMSSADDDTYLYLLDPDGNVIAENDDFNGLNSMILNLRLPEPGEYTIIATSFEPNATFSYELSVSDATPSQTVSVGETVQGELSADDAQSAALNGYYDFIGFDVSSDVTVDIEMSSPDGDTLLAVLDAEGAVVAANDDAGDSLDSRISRFAVGPDSDYTILATSFDPTATFSYELSVTESEPLPDLRSISLGETRTGGIDGNDPRESRFNGYYEPVTLDAPTGTTVDVSMSSANGDTYLYVLDPSGTVVAENDDYDGLNSRINRLTLSESGDYTIIATSFSDEDTFEYELSVTEGTDLSPEQSIAPGETLTSELGPEDPQSDRFNGYHEPIALDAPTGSTVTISMNSDGDTYLYLLDPSGQIVAQNDDYNGLNSEIPAFTLSESGDYTIIATSFSYDATFEYELSVTEIDSDLRSISVGETRTGVLDTSDPREDRFNGYYEPVTLTIDSTTTVDISMTSDGDTYLYLLDPSGTVIGENDDYSGLDSAITGVTLQSGEYTIIATSFSYSATFEYELTVRRA